MPDHPTCATCKHYETRLRGNVVEVDTPAASHYGFAKTIVARCNHTEAKWIMQDPPPDFGCIYQEPQDAA